MTSAGYVVLGGPPFETSANQTSMQMARGLSKHSRTLYVCRSAQDSGLRRLLGRGFANSPRSTVTRSGVGRVEGELFVLWLPALVNFVPLIRPEFSRRVALAATRRALIKACEQLELVQPNLITYWWMFPEIMSGPWRSVLFDVIDRHWSYPGQRNSERHQQTSRKLALRTAELANVTTTVSEGLARELVSARSTHIIPNGIDLELARRAADPGPVRGLDVGYVGGMNDRIDVPFLRSVLRAHPTWSFHFVGDGPVTKEIASESNVIIYGDRPYIEAMRILGKCRIGIIPFRRDPYTESSSFLKPLDYLAAGAHCVATRQAPLTALQQEFPDWVHVGDDLEDWKVFFRDVARRHTQKPPRIDLWDVSLRVQRLEHLINESR